MRGKLLGALLALTMAGGAHAETYPFDLAKKAPSVVRAWHAALPAPFVSVEWLNKLNGVGSPIRTISVGGQPMTYVSVCEPHNCDNNNLIMLVSADRTRVVAMVNWVEWDEKTNRNTPSVTLIGKMRPAEFTCLRRLQQDYDTPVC